MTIQWTNIFQEGQEAIGFLDNLLGKMDDGREVLVLINYLYQPHSRNDKKEAHVTLLVKESEIPLTKESHKELLNNICTLINQNTDKFKGSKPIEPLFTQTL